MFVSRESLYIIPGILPDGSQLEMDDLQLLIEGVSKQYKGEGMRLVQPFTLPSSVRVLGSCGFRLTLRSATPTCTSTNL